MPKLNTKFSILNFLGVAATQEQANAVAIGFQAGASSQGTDSVAVGGSAALNGQGSNAVAVGNSAAYLVQGANSVAVGVNAGLFYLGISSIAIGANAGNNQQGNNSIIINATGSNLRNTTANTFTVGTKSLVVCDSSTNPSATNLKTYAIASFTANGLATTEQNTIISTQVPQITQTRQTQTQDVTISRIVNTTVTTIGGVAAEPAPPRDPIAQTFFVGNNTNGILMTKMDVYFQSKSSTSPITLEIREVSNGYPAESVVPFSSVTLHPKDVNISSDATAPTEFKFASPVYLKNDTEYCFVLLPAGNDANYEVWVSELGENQIGTTQLPPPGSLMPHLISA